MCKAPQTLADGTVVGCRNCSQCFGRSVDDWTGRCIAESKFASAPFFVTLTYGRDENGNSDHLRAALLTYSDVQKYFKRLRKHGFPARYFAVGEYGSTKGRAHWHLLIFWQGPVPAHQPSTRADPVRFNQEHWELGFSTWEPLGRSAEDTAAAVRYVCKYLNKDLGGPERQALCRMSKKPLLGASWLHERARLHVTQGIAPLDLYYSFPGVQAFDGSPKRYMLRPGSAAADLFCQSFNDQWAAMYACSPLYARRKILRGPKGNQRLVEESQIVGFKGDGRPPPPSDLMDEYGDRVLRSYEGKIEWLLKDEKKLEEYRDRIRAKYWSPVYGAGFNLYPPHLQG
ncbi:rolling circle replication-associated protein [Mesorhizobium shangrilense]|uniref:Replication-associated protein ORF2/G2P domain-containing protein n=1 Tax=Mesorhizobium shangrilense TaxID=460060 RepID=A0ABV2DNF5_9HYPH